MFFFSASQGSVLLHTQKFQLVQLHYLSEVTSMKVMTKLYTKIQPSGAMNEAQKYGKELWKKVKLNKNYQKFVYDYILL